MVKLSTGQELKDLLEAHTHQGEEHPELREQIASKIVCDLGALSQQAYQEGNLSLTLKTNELLGKEFGLFGSKKDLSAHEWGQNILDMSSAQLRCLIEGILKALD